MTDIGQLLTIHVDGRTTSQQVLNPNILNLLQEAVDGYIEVIPYFDTIEDKSCVAFCDEEGKLKGKPINHAAQLLWRESMKKHNLALDDMLVGDVAIVIASKGFLDRL